MIDNLNRNSVEEASVGYRLRILILGGNANNGTLIGVYIVNANNASSNLNRNIGTHFPFAHRAMPTVCLTIVSNRNTRIEHSSRVELLADQRKLT